VDAKSHWEHVYRTRNPREVSWFQPTPALSLELIERLAPSRGSAIIDVGAGASTLADNLLAAGYRHVTALDISAAALELLRQRLGNNAALIDWREADILTDDIGSTAYDLWHDRAVFHFLTGAPDRARYVERVRRALRPSGHVVVATFADDGPTRCSGLDAMRYTASALGDVLGDGFQLVEERRESHRTPAGVQQSFIYAAFRFDSPSIGSNGP
jgi:SAM-dependent methyltransferase